MLQLMSTKGRCPHDAMHCVCTRRPSSNSPPRAASAPGAWLLLRLANEGRLVTELRQPHNTSGSTPATPNCTTGDAPSSVTIKTHMRQLGSAALHTSKQFTGTHPNTSHRCSLAATFPSPRPARCFPPGEHQLLAGQHHCCHPRCLQLASGWLWQLQCGCCCQWPLPPLRPICCLAHQQQQQHCLAWRLPHQQLQQAWQWQLPAGVPVVLKEPAVRHPWWHCRRLQRLHTCRCHHPQQGAQPPCCC
ncbi:hypothetical protein COO60DRAFT_1538659 [Scenedesmus sp. NREL 46B-D3]|nr:hypothetical protein COO60DRAFT_1538659 [Scenedesmus sp. NREL 46B-D3]